MLGTPPSSSPARSSMFSQPSKWGWWHSEQEYNVFIAWKQRSRAWGWGYGSGHGEVLAGAAERRRPRQPKRPDNPTHPEWGRLQHARKQAKINGMSIACLRSMRSREGRARPAGLPGWSAVAFPAQEGPMPTRRRQQERIAQAARVLGQAKKIRFKILRVFMLQALD